jgi:hypothetical protein
LPHVHYCLWTGHTIDQMIESETIVATLPQGHDDVLLPELGERLSTLVHRHQTHQCGAYCLKEERCRFGYPQRVHVAQTAFDPATNRFVYQRGEDDSRINPYNADMLRYAQCNLDLQYTCISGVTAMLEDECIL